MGLVDLHVLGDTASSLGSAVDELMRHQPSLRSEATKAIIKVCRCLFFPVFVHMSQQCSQKEFSEKSKNSGLWSAYF